jgi:hypothetical protein
METLVLILGHLATAYLLIGAGHAFSEWVGGASDARLLFAWPTLAFYTLRGGREGNHVST